MTTFADRVAAWLDEFLALDPVSATAIGDHRSDDRWPDMTEAGRAARLAFADRWLDELGAIDPSALSRDDLADRDVLVGELAAMRFRDTDLLEDRWDPLSWVYLLGGGLFPLLARGFAPLAVRLNAAAGRLEGIADVLAAARSQLVGTAGRPVSRLHTETAIRQLAGIGELGDEALAAAEGAPDDPAVVAIVPRIRTAVTAAREALAAFETYLGEVVLPRAEGEGQLGPSLFEAKLRHTLRSDLGATEILARAEREAATVRAEMIRIARTLWPAWVPDRPLPTADKAGSAAAAEQAIVHGVLDAIAIEHPRTDELLDACRSELTRIEAFCRDREIIGLADEPLQIMWTPVFLRAFGGAMLDSPGPLDTGEKAFFCITPIPDDWTAEQAESRLREDNDRHIRVLTIHEAVPGHYLQGVYANRCRSLPRTALWSGVFAEGWAVYITQVMMDLGYGAEDPALMLVHWKFYLRAAINAVIDGRIHGAGMTEDEAVRLMMDDGFQEESEARNKWLRARLSSTQLSTYFVGSVEFWEIEREARRRAAVASGDPRGAASVPEPRVVGGFGPTPGFRYREHLETVISHGTPPLPILRRLLFD
ncbi:MAG: DUF885 domain-containing protein [Chloroflexi bacterium]|nr:DUF885 domain-containing protein [Chloroflexota bacterium]